jgi:hypothetical protein
MKSVQEHIARAEELVEYLDQRLEETRFHNQLPIVVESARIHAEIAVAKVNAMTFGYAIAPNLGLLAEMDAEEADPEPETAS